MDAQLAYLEDRWDPTLTEQLDQDFQKVAAQLEPKCKCKPNVAYIEKLTTARKEKSVLRQILTEVWILQGFHPLKDEWLTGYSLELCC